MGYDKLISADDHIFEPPDMWINRVDPKYKDRAPRIVTLEKGDDWWYTDGIKGMPVGATSHLGERFEGNENLSLIDESASMERVPPGAYDPDARIKDMDLDGVGVSLNYANQGLLLYSVPDTELVNALMSTYNDWLAEYCVAYSKRLLGIGMINLDDVEWGVKEIERCHKLGLAGAMIPVFPMPGRGYHLPEYEPVWEAAEGLGVPLSLHLGTIRPGSVPETQDIETLTPEYFINVDYWVRMSLSQIIFGGVFERHPRLMIGSVENEAAWIVHFLERMDYNYTQRPRFEHWHRYKEDMLPSDYFRRNIFVSLQEDEPAIRFRDDIGIDTLQWGSDYPHIESTFPKSREILGKMLADCTEEEQAKITWENAARVYNIDLN